MTADNRDARLNRALAERLEPLESCLATTKEDADRIPPWRDYRSPKGLWTSLHGGCEPRRFHDSADAAVALAEAFAKEGHDARLAMSPWADGWSVAITVGSNRCKEAQVFGQHSRAVRDAVAAALGVEVK